MIIYIYENVLRFAKVYIFMGGYILLSSNSFK